MRHLRASGALAALLAALGSALTLGCSSGGDAPSVAARSTERVPPQQWQPHLSAARYSQIESSIHYLEADDGTQLALTLHLPVGVPAGERLPTLLQLTPYQSFLNLRTYTPATGTERPGTDWLMFVHRGAAYVEADARGGAASGGCLDFGGSLDRADAVVFADWIRAQDWSNGVIVSDGVSHPGMGSVVAHAAVPELTAALAHAPVVSYYQDEWLQGAKFEDQLNGPLYEVVEVSPPLYAAPEALAAQAAPCRGETTLAFSALEGTFTPLWDDRHLGRHRDTALAQPRPVLLTHGFVDLNVHPDHTQLYWDALPDDYPKHLIMGWWYHGWPDLGGHPFFDFGLLRHRWLDTVLLGIDNGLAAEPRVLVEDSQGRWHESQSWPLSPSQPQQLLTSADGALLADGAVAGEVSYTDALGATRGSWADAHVAFRSEPLPEARLINGAPVVHLAASSDQDQTKWVAYLLDESPEGRWQRISHGYVDSHQWDGEDRWQAMRPGQIYHWDIQLQPTAVVVAADHRVTLVISSQDSRNAEDPRSSVCFSDYRGGCYSPSGILPSATAGRALNTVHTGPDGTSVQWHWVDPKLTAKPPWPSIPLQ